MSYTVGTYLAERLVQIGLKHHFAVAGDYNLVLLDNLLLNKNMEQVYCCNELNCGFSAEGYARAKGAAAAVVTYSVGALSAFDAIGGAYAENLPVILISGAPNNNDHAAGHVLHHALGKTDYHYQLEMAKNITAAAEAIYTPEEAPAKIDHVIKTALREKKPVYLEIACNIASMPCAAPGPASALFNDEASDEASLNAAVEETLKFIANRDKVAVLVGSKLRAAGAEEAAVKFADALGGAVATMAAAKSFFPEENPHYIGTSWGEVSYPGVEKTMKEADAVIALAPVFNDYSTTGWTDIPDPKKLVLAEPRSVVVNGIRFPSVHLKDYLTRLAQKVSKKTGALDFFKSLNAGELKKAAPADPSAPLVNAEIARQVEALLTPNTTVIAETGDSWFNAQRMKLPNGARVEYEMQWGHIGWSVPAAFGYAVGAPERRNILMVGDGSFQLTAQEVAQMVRLKLPVIIFLINNYGYTIAVMIHDGPYNNIKNWDYAGLMEVFNGNGGYDSGAGKGLKAKTGGELAEAIKVALANTDGPTLIECFIGREDCTEELVKWGKRVAAANSRKPVNKLL
uniref:Pyruvate decarboxylase n=1 Tax=Zymomonas mobilis TaxID=542 RepID=UPI0006EC42B2|nr:Chain A, Pyruvate decarboxylase [Zymomonas mobilis]4ZP1_B Chain B, Pyruvate decarboxylase [Zymomonas mobilis]4ZP1_C Chain C, Pyruvate decarboxylase [Zymomonas mobilis]4ZP1_D Chain D, Pyruvate decarboxylase [Zymomonas mobilis]